jgi:DNA-binding transcriptional LysR family regulator
MDIELKLLRSFVAIYEHGTLSRAADAIGITQAAMSMRLKLIETEIGGLLFLRQHHRLEPTSKGAELYAKALSVLAAYDEMISATRSQKPRQKLRLGVPDDYALGILPKALARLGNDSGYDIEIVCDLSAALAAKVQHRELDVALATLAARPSGAVFEAEVQLRWVMLPESAAAARDAVALAAYPEGCVFRRAMIERLDAARVPWHVQAQSRTHAGIIAAVKAGIAVTSMAKGTAPAGLSEIRSTERLPALPDVPIYLIADRPSRLSQLLQDELAVLAGPGAWRQSA